MGRAPCCEKENVKRGTWSPEEDATLKNYLETHGTGGNWIALPKKAGLRRCGKSCRLRWLNYLRPNIKHGGFTEEEDNIICTLYSQMGSRWSTIASKLPGRTDNDIKNYWNTKLKKKIMAGVKIKSLTDSDIFPSTSQLAKTQNSTSNSDIFASTNQNSPPSATLPMLELDNYYDANHGFEQIHQPYNPNFMDIVSEIGTSNNNVNVPMMSLSQEGSSISDSSSIAMNNNKCVSQQQEQAGDEFGFGFPYDLVNGLNCHERIDEFAPSCSYPEWVDFSYADFKPH